jgi:feruloyl esterase
VTTLYAQGAGGVQFRDWTVPVPTANPAITCGELLSLTSFDLSVISATMIPGAADAPEHCRVRLMVQPEINIEVNLPSRWNNRLYMFGNGGWAGESFDSPGRAANRAHV